jgi:hypothetical protein
MVAPENLRKYEAERDIAAKRQAIDPARHLDDVYAEIIELLRNPDQSEKEKQEKIRRLFESHEGPIQ